MSWSHKCEGCNCNLDPGEGLLCDDCKEKAQKILPSPNVMKSITRALESSMKHDTDLARLAIMEEQTNRVRKVLTYCYKFDNSVIDAFFEKVLMCDVDYEALLNKLLRGVKLEANDLDGLYSTL